MTTASWAKKPLGAQQPADQHQHPAHDAGKIEKHHRDHHRGKVIVHLQEWASGNQLRVGFGDVMVRVGVDQEEENHPRRRQRRQQQPRPTELGPGIFQDKPDEKDRPHYGGGVLHHLPTQFPDQGETDVFENEPADPRRLVEGDEKEGVGPGYRPAPPSKDGDGQGNQQRDEQGAELDDVFPVHLVKKLAYAVWRNNPSLMSG